MDRLVLLLVGLLTFVPALLLGTVIIVVALLTFIPLLLLGLGVEGLSTQLF